MQQLLAEAWEEFEIEDPARVPSSVYVVRYQEECQTVKEETVIGETAKEDLYYEEETVREEGASTKYRTMKRRPS